MTIKQCFSLFKKKKMASISSELVKKYKMNVFFPYILDLNWL